MSPRLAEAAKTKASQLVQAPDGSWRLASWASPRIVAGITDRRSSGAGRFRHPVEAEQVHGASVAVIRSAPSAGGSVAGCDALVTDVAGITLLVRTADCLPLFFADPRRGVVGVAHAGWRGLAASLPARVMGVFRRMFCSRAEDLQVAIGPAIRACCYEVGPEFEDRFGPFVRQDGGRRPFDSAHLVPSTALGARQGGVPSGVEGRRTCDLIAAAKAQLAACGLRDDRLLDTRRCTGCEPDVWFSLRREGPDTGRLLSYLMVRS